MKIPCKEKHCANLLRNLLQESRRLHLRLLRFMLQSRKTLLYEQYLMLFNFA